MRRFGFGHKSGNSKQMFSKSQDRMRSSRVQKSEEGEGLTTEDGDNFNGSRLWIIG